MRWTNSPSRFKKLSRLTAFHYFSSFIRHHTHSIIVKDFTLETYRLYLQAIRRNFDHILRFDEFLNMESGSRPDSFCIIRHDVDRKPANALKMALMERDLEIRSTYYFRTKPRVFRPEFIKTIQELGHEIGYHYECLSDEKGNRQMAMINFEQNLSRLREIATVNSISMHGRPLSKYDNRDMWKFENAREKLKNDFGINGEIYLHIDYSEIAYIGDTGRNWDSAKSNKRDFVNSKINLNIKDGKALLDLLQNNPPSKLVFQIHPERWTDNKMEFEIQKLRDSAVNIVKSFR